MFFENKMNICRTPKYLLSLFVLTLVVNTCSPSTRYKVLSLVFDGVPAPTTVSKTDSLQTVNSKSNNLSRKAVSAGPKNFYHPPYQERACDDCHSKSGSGQIEPQPQLCYECHDDFSEEYSVLHGPVASGNCTSCHNPHMSKNENLLRVKKEQLCLYCHEAALVFKNENHEDVEPGDCMDCHNVHGSDEKFML